MATNRNMFRVERMFNGNRAEAKLISAHRKLDSAVRAASKWRGGEGWGVRILDRDGNEIEIGAEMRRLRLA